jgi:hypothetical protein
MKNLTSNPLYDSVLDAIRKIVSSIEYGVLFNEASLEIYTPDGDSIDLPRYSWKRELQAAVGFFENAECYEDCALCVKLIEKLDNEPTIEQIIRQVSDHAQDNQTD